MYVWKQTVCKVPHALRKKGRERFGERQNVIKWHLEWKIQVRSKYLRVPYVAVHFVRPSHSLNVSDVFCCCRYVYRTLHLAGLAGLAVGGCMSPLSQVWPLAHFKIILATCRQ